MAQDEAVMHDVEVEPILTYLRLDMYTHIYIFVVYVYMYISMYTYTLTYVYLVIYLGSSIYVFVHSFMHSYFIYSFTDSAMYFCSSNLMVGCLYYLLVMAWDIDFGPDQYGME